MPPSNTSPLDDMKQSRCSLPARGRTSLVGRALEQCWQRPAWRLVLSAGFALAASAASPVAARGNVAEVLAESSSFASVGALFERDDSGWLSLRCSGVLLEPDVVLTSANCLLRRDLDGAMPANQLLFVPDSAPWPPVYKRQHVGRHIVVHDQFEINRREQTPLALRMPHGDKERSALRKAVELCGERDTDPRRWLSCVLEQPEKVVLSMGLGTATNGEHDLGLLFLQPGTLSGKDAEPAFVPATDTQSSLWTRAGAHGHSPVHHDDKLTVVGYGRSSHAEPRGSNPWFPQLHEDYVAVGRWFRQLYEDYVSERMARRALWATAVKVQAQEFQLNQGTPTCSTDSGGGVFRQRVGGGQKLVGMVTRRLAVWQEGPCGDSATVVQLSHYLPWITEQMSLACDSNLRAQGACEASPVSAPAKMGE